MTRTDRLLDRDHRHARRPLRNEPARRFAHDLHTIASGRLEAVDGWLLGDFAPEIVRPNICHITSLCGCR